MITKLEEPLPAGGSCLLGSFNLSAYVENNRFKFGEFERDIKAFLYNRKKEDK